MRLINIGFNNIVIHQRIVAVINPDSSPVKKLIEAAREKGSLIDATCGRRTRSVIVTDSNHIILSALQPETIGDRFSQKREKSDKNQHKLKRGTDG